VPTTPNLGIQYPDGSATPSRKNWVEDPIVSVDTQVQALLTAMGLAGKRIESGVVTVPVSGTPSTGQVNVTFSQPFSGNPVIIISSGNWLYNATWGNRTPSGFQVSARRTTDASSTVTNIVVSWFAVGNR